MLSTRPRTHCRALPSFQSVEKFCTVKCGLRTALIQASMSLFGGTLVCDPIWYLLISNQIIPRINFVLPPTTSSGPKVININKKKFLFSWIRYGHFIFQCPPSFDVAFIIRICRWIGTLWVVSVLSLLICWGLTFELHSISVQNFILQADISS